MDPPEFSKIQNHEPTYEVANDVVDLAMMFPHSIVIMYGSSTVGSDPHDYDYAVINGSRINPQNVILRDGWEWDKQRGILDTSHFIKQGSLDGSRRPVDVWVWDFFSEYCICLKSPNNKRISETVRTANGKEYTIHQIAAYVAETGKIQYAGNDAMSDVLIGQTSAALNLWKRDKAGNLSLKGRRHSYFTFDKSMDAFVKSRIQQ